MRLRGLLGSAAILCGVLPGATAALAGELGHYAPGLANIRDLTMPGKPGFYFALYTYYYTTDTIKDRDGDTVDSVDIRGVNLSVKADVDAVAISPAVVWVSPWEVLGAKYAIFVAPSIMNTAVQASLHTATGLGQDTSSGGDFGFGDLFVQPLWLGWSGPNFDAMVDYGFFAPTGRFDEDADDNIGLGFWEHQFQIGGTWYPFESRGTALTMTGTFNIAQEIEGTDTTPGARFSLNWGISQYIPLDPGPTWMAEAGILGYDQWQIDQDSGSDVSDDVARDEVHAAGLQFGVSYLPWESSLTFHWLHEFAAEARFQGDDFVLTLGKAF